MRIAQMALLAFLLALAATGCALGDVFGSGEGEDVPAGLTAYEGKGLRAAYPADWKPPAKQRRLIPGADFEVAGPRTASGLPKGTFAVIVEREEQSVGSLVAHYAGLAKTRRDGKVLEQGRIEAGGTQAYTLRQAYTASAGRDTLQIRQVDVYLRVSPEEIADIRLVYPASAYEAAGQQIESVISAIRVSGSGS